jgi:hypothetical protein
MKNVEFYLGSRTELQISLIRGILALMKDGEKRFSSEMVAKKSKIHPKLIGGAWTAFTQKTKKFPPLLAMRGKKIERDMDGKIIENIQYWGVNEQVDWDKIGEKINHYV